MLQDIIVAKTNDLTASQWLPLSMHSADTAGIMGKLVDNWLPDCAKKECSLDFELLRKLSVLLGFLHDFGKMTSRFQCIITEQMPTYRLDLNNKGLSVLENRQYVYPSSTPHAYAGQWILQSRYINQHLDQSLLNIIGAHHGRPMDERDSDSSQIDVYSQNIFGTNNSKKTWSQLWNSALYYALEKSGFSSSESLPKLSVQAQVILSGLLVTADWLASNTEFFPLISIGSIVSRDEYPARVELAWTKISFPDQWQSNNSNMTASSFYEKFGFQPNIFQSKVMEIANHIEYPGIMILEAPMGIGKTEAALTAADIISANFGQDGIFFGLPTQATSNGLFPRLLNWAEKETKGTVNSIRLAHSAAEFNIDYDNLLSKNTYVNNFDPNGEQRNGLEVHPWFSGNKKALLADFVIGTVDQLLMSVLKRKHFMLRHLGLCGKVVIIDECHAYDAYMNQYLDRAIMWMAAYQIPVILLSATLPSKRRQELVSSYLKSYCRYNLNYKAQQLTDIVIPNGLGYPLITWTEGSSAKQCAIKQNNTSQKIAIAHINDDSLLINDLLDKLSDGGCAVVILNTVKRAQFIYELITNDQIVKADKFKVILYHAQFTIPDRAKKEEYILSLLGKKSTPELRNKVIVIGTQVLEQSLDYDADIMYSELCPIDLLLQRAGRLHRHERQRPKKLCLPVLTILCESNDAYNRGTSAVYGDYLLLRTQKLLPTEMSFPSDITCLVQKTYDFENDLGIKGAAYTEAKGRYEYLQQDKKERANNFLMGKPDPQTGLLGLLQNDNDIDDKQAEASVRDGSYSFEVILIKRGDNNDYVLISDYQKKEVFFSDSNAIDTKLIKEISRERIRLPGIFAAPYNYYQTIRDLKQMSELMPISLKESPWFKDTFFLLLDQEMKAQIGEYHICYNNNKGLTYEKRGDEVE